MCIAIYKKEGFLLTPETLENCWNNNPDGAGFMYAEDNKLNVIKGLMTFEEFLSAYKPHENKDCVLHFRIKTHGKTNQEMTHPFLIDENLGFVHNGILSKINTSSDNEKSDTWHFAQLHLSELRLDNPKFFLNPVYKELIESFIGYNKLIFMDNEGNVEIFNEKQGTWNSSCWFSNDSWNVSTKPYELVSYKPKKNIWKPSAKSDFVLGEIYQLQEDAGYGKNLIPKGSYAEIKAFGIGIVVHIEEILTGIQVKTTIDKLINIKDNQPPKFKIGDNCKFIQNYNHFRIGETVKCTGVTPSNNEVLVKKTWNFKTGISEKEYWIKQHMLEVVEPTTTDIDLVQQHSEFSLAEDPYHIWD